MQVRVTEVLSFFKEQWYIDWVHKVGRTEANKISKAAMRLGTTVDSFIKGTPGQIVEIHKNDMDGFRNCTNAYHKWNEVYQPKFMMNGERLYAEIDGHQVSGEPDIFVDGVLVDIKCASKISPSYWIQVNMYRYLQGDRGKVGVLRLDKTTGSFEYVVKDYDETLVNVWIGLMRAMVYFKGDDDGADIREGQVKEGVA